MSLPHVELNESSMPSSPIPDPPTFGDHSASKRQRVEDISEEQVKQIVDILGSMLYKIKNEILDIKEKYAPSAAAVNFLLRRTDDISTTTTNDVYCLMTGFMTVYLVFIELLLKDLMILENSQIINNNPLEDFMQLFSVHDSLFGQSDGCHGDTATNDNQQQQQQQQQQQHQQQDQHQGNQHPFLWYYLYARNHTSILNDLHHQLKSTLSITFTSLNHIDSIFSRFYTLHFLEASAQKHQKDHGQYYTPQSVIRFMWDRCASVSALSTRLQESPDNAVPRVFDPCLGIGSFLCEFLSRLVTACRFTPTIWNDPNRIYNILTKEIPQHIWGIEIDPFAFQLCKINMLIHLFPFYQRLIQHGVLLQPNIIQRIRLFCNDTLKLDIESNPFHQSPTTDNNNDDLFEIECLSLLRDANKLKFHYIVTNPPYMIRKTGFITQPDPTLYNEDVLGGRGTQAYLYFMWICLQRCDDLLGQVCLITPSQWTVLEFAEHLRNWIWSNCRLLEMYEFEPYKVWPKVQTDSLIFRVCKRSSILPRIDQTIYLRHISPRRVPLKELLRCYEDFNMDNYNSNNNNNNNTNTNTTTTTTTTTTNNNNNNNNNINSNQIIHPDIMYKCTSTNDVDHDSLSVVLPTTSVLDKLIALTEHLPRICDGEIRRGGNASNGIEKVMVVGEEEVERDRQDGVVINGDYIHHHEQNNMNHHKHDDIAPLVWNRGPNTNPVYSLVVRTEWALLAFGIKACTRWLRPCFYWNGKSGSSGCGGGKEGKFWRERDPLRLNKKEFSPAEAYQPFCHYPQQLQVNIPFYSMIMVNKEDAETLKRECDLLGEQSESYRLYHYLIQARTALQPTKNEKELAYCQYNKSGAEHGIKLVHPINCGYFTRSQPRQRFFLDKSRMAVTNQCIYFTIKEESPVQDAEFFCGLLNCSLLQFFIKSTCYYDRQGRMRFFGKLMANIPYMPPPKDDDHRFINTVARFVKGTMVTRHWLYAIIKLTNSSNNRSLMERVRNGEWELSQTEIDLLSQIANHGDPSSSHWQQQQRLPEDDVWKINDFVLKSNGQSIVQTFSILLKITSLFQYAIDQLIYFLYKIPLDLQLGLEKELNLQDMRSRWLDLPHLEEHGYIAWSECIIQYAEKLTFIS